MISSAKNSVDSWLGKTRNLGISGHVGELKIMRCANTHSFIRKFKMLIIGNWRIKCGRLTMLVQERVIFKWAGKAETQTSAFLAGLNIILLVLEISKPEILNHT